MGPQDATEAPGSTDATAIEVARRLLTDFLRCPSCATVLGGSRCPACGVDLSGPSARRVGELSVRAGELLTEREAILRVLRERADVRAATASAPQPSAAQQPGYPQQPGAQQPGYFQQPGAQQPGAQQPGAQQPGAQQPAQVRQPGRTRLPLSVPTGRSDADLRVPLPPPLRPAPGRLSGLGVHGLLVGLGALLLAVAAVGFLVFSWRVLSLPGRAAVIAAVTLAVLGTASWLRPRLPETAEAVGALGVVLVLADSWAIRGTGLFGADRPDGLIYAAAAAAGCAALLASWALISRVRAGSLAAVVLAPLAVLLPAIRWDDGRFDPVPTLAVGFLLVGVLSLGRELLPADWQSERMLLRVIGAGALIGAAVPAGVGRPGAGRAALVLLAAALVAVAAAGLDRVARVPDRVRSVQLRRSWSLAAGLFAGTAAVQVGLGPADVLDGDAVTVLLPLLGLPAITMVAAATVRTSSVAAFRRSAFAAGTVIVAAPAAVPLVGLAGWLPLRAALIGARAWSVEPGSRFGTLDPQTSGSAWAVAVSGLLLLSGCALVAVRIGGWPAWLRRPVRAAGIGAAAAAVFVLPLLPSAPVAAVVVGLALLSFAAAAAAVLTTVPALASDKVPTPVPDKVPAPVPDETPDGRGRSRTWLIAAWTASALSGTLAVVLAWSCRELSVPATVLGLVGLLLARRRIPVSARDRAAVAARTTLAGLAFAAAMFAVAAVAGLAGVSVPLRIVWAGLAGGLSVAALIGPIQWADRLPAAGRAGWSATDRLVAGVPGLAALCLGLMATLSDSPGTPVDVAWARPVLLAVALLVVLTGAGAVRPTIVSTLPILPLTCAVLGAPVLGGLIAAIRAATSSDLPAWPQLSLAWAVAAAIGALLTAAVVLSGRADPARRPALELGVLVTGMIAVTLVNAPEALWPVLLVLGAGAAAIAATPGRQRIGWLAGLLLTGSTWTRLAVDDVGLVEAYSLPPALALLLLALYRFRQDDSTDPVRALAPVATVGIAPSILVAVGGSPLRPAVLIVLGAVLVVAGRQLQRRNRTALGTVLAGVGVLTAAATAMLRAGAVLSEPAGSPAVWPVETWTVPAALVVLFAALAVRLELPGQAIAPGLARSVPLLGAVLLAGLPTLVVALQTVDPLDVLTGVRPVVDDWSAVLRAAAVLGGSVIVALVARTVRFRFRSIGAGLPAGATLLAVAAALTGLSVSTLPVEVWSLPLAALLLIQGRDRFTAGRPITSSTSTPSWPAYGPGIAVLLLPSLYLGLTPSDSPLLRQLLVIVLASAILVFGATRRLQAPLLGGAGVLAVQAVALLLPWFALLSGAVPVWGWVAVVGLGLVMFGARYEARMQQLRGVGLRLSALH
jgi:hypothetical protein